MRLRGSSVARFRGRDVAWSRSRVRPNPATSGPRNRATPRPRDPSLVLRQFLQPRPQLRLARLGLLDHRGRGVAHELLVRQARVEAFQLLAALLDLPLRAL